MCAPLEEIKDQRESGKAIGFVLIAEDGWLGYLNEFLLTTQVPVMHELGSPDAPSPTNICEETVLSGTQSRKLPTVLDRTGSSS